MLNKNGWGLREMLVFMGIIIVCLLISIYYINNLFSYFATAKEPFFYSELENKLEEQAKIYLDKYYEKHLISEYITITKDMLEEYNLDTILYDEDYDICDGYVRANKSHGIVNIKAYIKCDKYQTKGYEEMKINEEQ